MTCDNCSTPLKESDYFGHYESTGECHGFHREFIADGYICSNCGHEEAF